MFVPVSCTSCGKPFQVPEAALGKLAPCPWCQAIVTALPVSSPEPQLEPEPPSSPTAPPAPEQPKPTALTPAQQEPLSLDDEEPVQGPGANEPPSKPKRVLVPICVALVLMVVGTVGTLLYRNYGAGRMSDSGWTEFTPPDGSFTIALPGKPVEEPVEANPIGSVTGGKRYTVREWFSKTNVWVAYNDLDPSLVQKLPADRGGVLAAGALQAEREREKARLEGTITNEVTYRHMTTRGIELHLDTPRGKVVEWLVLADAGAHPRVYVFGAEGKGLTHESPVCGRLRDSFRVNN
jgi:hypothetical protein